MVSTRLELHHLEQAVDGARAADDHELRARLRQSTCSAEAGTRCSSSRGTSTLVQVEDEVLERLVRAPPPPPSSQLGQRGDVELSLDVHVDVGADVLGAQV